MYVRVFCTVHGGRRRVVGRYCIAADPFATTSRCHFSWALHSLVNVPYRVAVFFCRRPCVAIVVDRNDKDPPHAYGNGRGQQKCHAF